MGLEYCTPTEKYWENGGKYSLIKTASNSRLRHLQSNVVEKVSKSSEDTLTLGQNREAEGGSRIDFNKNREEAGVRDRRISPGIYVMKFFQLEFTT